MNEKLLSERDILIQFMIQTFKNIGWDKMEQIEKNVILTAAG
jgi:hypothetical protein